MLIRYLQDTKVAYNGINITYEKKGNTKNVEEKLARALISSGRAVDSKMDDMKQPCEVKAVTEYDNKAVKTYENKAINVKRGRPKKTK